METDTTEEHRFALPAAQSDWLFSADLFSRLESFSCLGILTWQGFFWLSWVFTHGLSGHFGSCLIAFLRRWVGIRVLTGVAVWWGSPPALSLSRTSRCWAAWTQHQCASSSPFLRPRPLVACSPPLWCPLCPPHPWPQSWITSGWTPSRRTPAQTRMPTRMALRRIPSQIAVQPPSRLRTLQTIRSPEVKRPRPSSCSVRTAWTARRPSASSQLHTGLSWLRGQNIFYEFDLKSLHIFYEDLGEIRKWLHSRCWSCVWTSFAYIILVWSGPFPLKRWGESGWLWGFQVLVFLIFIFQPVVQKQKLWLD